MRTLFLLAFVLLAAAPSFADELAAARQFTDGLLSYSDADYAELVKDARANSKYAAWSGKSRTELASTLYRGMADYKRRAPAADAAAATPDAEQLVETGWADAISAYVNHNYTVRTPTAVAAVRGGRKLSTAEDKAVAKALAAADAAEKAGRAVEVAAAYEAAAAALEATPAAKALPAAAAPAPMSPQEIYRKDAPAVLLIVASEKGSSQGELGTGSYLAGGRVLTNAHVVVNDATKQPYGVIRIYRKPAKVTGDPKRDMTDPVLATVTRFDRDLDLALLHVDLPGTPTLKLGDDSAVEPGDPVVAIGHPEQGGLWTLTQGVVSTVIADLGGVKGKNAFQTDASINRGNSGGPLIDRAGRIVGVNTSMARKAADGLTITSVNFSVRSSVAADFLGDVLPSDAPAVAQAEAPAAPAAPAPVKPAEAPKPAPAAPAKPAELPPAPKTEPKILTPVKPYKEADAIAEGVKEMEDLESEMRGEIQRRLGK